MNRLAKNSYEWNKEYAGAIKFLALFGLLEKKERNTLAPKQKKQKNIFQIIGGVL